MKYLCLLMSLFFAVGNVNAFCSHGKSSAEQDVFSYKESSTLTYNITGTDSVTSTQSEVKISYISKTINSKQLAIRFPKYTYYPKAGACACVAGGNILGYYDRFDEELIPNHKSGTAIGNTFSYSIEDAAVEKVIDQLYDYMGTDESGTTQAEFINGLNRYCQEKGKTVSYSSCMQSGSFDYSLAKSKLENNEPIILFLSKYNVALLSEGEKEDTISYLDSSVNHIMIGFGYKEYIYTLSNAVSTYSFISVASGLIERSSGQFDINHNSKINDALAVKII